MKKIIYSIMALATMVFMHTSCTNDDSPAEEYVQVSYTTKLPNGISSRTIGDGKTVTHVACAVYDVTEPNNPILITGLKDNNKIIELTNGAATFTPTLIKGRNYKIAFWAFYNDNNSPAYNVYGENGAIDLTAIKKNGEWLCNDETADAFTYVIDACLSSTAATQPVALKRPFARLRFGMTESDWDNTANLVATPTHTSMHLSDGFYTQFNALTGEPIGSKTTVDLALNNVDGEKYKVGETTYKTLAFAYVLMPTLENNKIDDVTLHIKGDDGDVDIASTTISSVPSQGGYNTNVSGNLLTGSVSYTITIDPTDEETEIESIQ